MNWHDYFEYKDGKIYWKDYDSEKLGRRRIQRRFIGKEVGGIDKSLGYVRVNMPGKKYWVHRIIWEMHNGAIPEGMQIDHINHVRNDNRIENLRLVTIQENRKNQSINSRNKTGVTGVCIVSMTGKYVAQIKKDGENIHLGFFDNIHDASIVRARAEFILGYHKNHGRKDE